MKPTIRTGRLPGALLVWAMGASAQAACGEQLTAHDRLLAEGSGWQVAFAPRSGAIRVGQPFALDLIVCGNGATAGAPRVQVDADMPAHKHGMNYRPVVTSSGERSYLAEGLMFHMPGRWRFLIDIETAPGLAVRLSREIELQ